MPKLPIVGSVTAPKISEQKITIPAIGLIAGVFLGELMNQKVYSTMKNQLAFPFKLDKEASTFLSMKDYVSVAVAIIVILFGRKFHPIMIWVGLGMLAYHMANVTEKLVLDTPLGYPLVDK